MGKLAKFDFTWFIPAIIKYRKIFVEVMIVSIYFLQLFALITPLFFQVVMDKVLVHRGFSTLNVITVALAIVVIFEIVLSGLRTYGTPQYQSDRCGTRCKTISPLIGITYFLFLKIDVSVIPSHGFGNWIKYVIF